MANPDDRTLCLCCGVRGEIYGTGDEDHPFSCHACDAWGMTEDKVDTPYEEDPDGLMGGQAPNRSDDE